MPIQVSLHEGHDRLPPTFWQILKCFHRRHGAIVNRDGQDSLLALRSALDLDQGDGTGADSASGKRGSMGYQHDIQVGRAIC
jgi:hypothetical protein